MLMPSAIPCDSSQQQHHQSGSHTRLQSALFVSPPASPPTLSNQGAIGNIFSTCRSLQALLTPAAVSSSDPAPATQLPTPPLAHAPPPLKLRLRPRPAKSNNPGEPHFPRKKIAKRAPPRGANKRRRAHDDDLGRNDLHSEPETDDDVESELDISPLAGVEAAPESTPAPRTPKRARIAPEVIPLGLGRSDFHNLHLTSAPSSSSTSDPSTSGLPLNTGDVEVEADGERWSTEDDRILVELVLEKLKLSKTEWQDCARSLGKDRNSLSRRWKSLMSKGDVGLKPTRGRRRLHATWR